MTNQFHAIYETDDDWIIGYCSEIPGANGMGKTQVECRENLIEAVKLILEDRYEDTLRGLTEDCTSGLITI